MKRYIVLLLCAGLCLAQHGNQMIMLGSGSSGGGGGFPTPAYVNGSICSTGGFNCALSALSLTAGNVVIVGFASQNAGSTLSVTDNGSGAVGTWTSACGPYTNALTPGTMVQLFWAKVNSSATVTITANDSSNTNQFEVVGAQYSGISTTSPVDQCPAAVETTTVTNGSTALSGTTSTTTQTEELLVGLFYFQDSSATYCSDTAGSGYTLRQCSTQSGRDVNLEDHVVSVTGTYQASLTWHDPLNSNASDAFATILTLKAGT